MMAINCPRFIQNENALLRELLVYVRLSEDFSMPTNSLIKSDIP